MRKLMLGLFIAGLIAIAVYTHIGYAIAAFFASVIIWVIAQFISLIIDIIRTEKREK